MLMIYHMEWLVWIPNNLPGIYEALMEAGLIYETGFTMKSGFNTYPVALFNVDELPELEVQN